MEFKFKKNNLPNSILLKIIYTGAGILWEKIARYLLLLLFIVLLFFCLTMLNFFTSLPVIIHILFLFIFFMGSFIFLLKIILSLKWPNIKSCVRRLEIDNQLKNRPLSVLFDTPALNKKSILWKKHYIRMLDQVQSIKNFKSKAILKLSDPLFIRFPFLLISFVIIFSNSNNYITKVEAALIPDFSVEKTTSAIFTGWISPPKYTGISPILLSETMSQIDSPQGSILTARIFGGKGVSKLVINNQEKDFIKIDKDNFALESLVEDTGMLMIWQDDNVIFSKNLNIIKDQPPIIKLLNKPEKTVKGVLKIGYILEDDYGIKNLQANVIIKDKRSSLEETEIFFSIPFDPEIKGSQFSEYYYDLTEHIWAGMPVLFFITGKDFVGNEGKSKEHEILLPERDFKNPLAISLINQRKNLGLELISVEETIFNLALIEENKYLHDNYFIAHKWLSEVVQSLKESITKSNVEGFKQIRKKAIDKLWKAALFVESGQLAKAEEDLRKAQEALKEALSQSNDASEVQESIDNLDEALGKYLDEIEDPMNVDAPQVSESDDPGDRGGENGAQTNERQDLEKKLEEIADLAVAGSLDEAEKQLEEMQDTTEALDRDALGEALGEEEGESQPMAMQQISEMIEQQEALMEDSFEASMNAAQADQQTPGSGPVNAGKEQDTLRKQLEDVMKEIAESDDPIPEELGRADRAMRQASRELNRNRPDRAESAQGKAIEELKKAAESIDRMHSSSGPSQMAGQNENNRSRDRRDPLGRVPPGQGSSPGGDVGLPNEPDITRARKIAKQLYLKAEESLEGTVERRYVDSLLDWY